MNPKTPSGGTVSRNFVQSATVLLKVRIGEAEIKGVKENSAKKNPPGYVCSVLVLDRNYQPVGTAELSYQSGVVTSIAKGWNQNCALNLFAPWPQFYSSLRVSVMKNKEGKEPKVIATTHIQLDEVPTEGKLEKKFPLLDSREKETGSIALTLNWFGNKALVSAGEKKKLESMFVHNEKLTTTAPQMINVNPNGNLRKSQPGSPRREFTNPHLQQHQQQQQQSQATQEQGASPKRPTQNLQPQQQQQPSPTAQDQSVSSKRPTTQNPQPQQGSPRKDGVPSPTNSQPTIITSTVSEPSYQDLLTTPELPKTESPLTPPRNRKTTLMEDPIAARQKAIGLVYKSTEQEALKLEQKLAALKEKVELERKKKEKIQSILLRYRDVDKDIAELVGGSIDWSVIREKEQPELKQVGKSIYVTDDDPPRLWAEYITSQSNLEHIPRITRKLSEADPLWLKDFLLADGLVYIYTMLHTLETAALDKTKYVDGAKQTELATLLIIVMNTQSAAEYIIRDQELVMKNIIILILGSNNNMMKITMFYFIAAVAIYGRHGNKLVKNAFGHFGDSDQEGRNSKYEILFQTISFSSDPELIIAGLAVINCILVGEKNLSDRMSSRNLFTQKLSKIFEKLRTTYFYEPALIKQLDSFDYMAEQDNRELREMRFAGINLTDPHMLLRCIISQTNSLDVYDIFLRHLQQLMLIPQCRTNPITLWRYIERSSRAITSAGAHKIISQKEENFHVFLYKILHGEKVRELMIEEAHSAQQQEDELLNVQLQLIKNNNNPIHQGDNVLATNKNPRSQSFGTFGTNERIINQQQQQQQIKSPRSMSFVQYNSTGQPLVQVKQNSPLRGTQPPKQLNTRSQQGGTQTPYGQPLLNYPHGSNLVRANSAQSFTHHSGHEQSSVSTMKRANTQDPSTSSNDQQQREREAMAQQQALAFNKPKGPIKRGGPVPKLGLPNNSNNNNNNNTNNSGGVSPKNIQITFATQPTIPPQGSPRKDTDNSTDLNKMFESLQNDFLPIDALSTNKFVGGRKAGGGGGQVKKKVQLLPPRMSSNIAIFRKQYKFTDYEFMKYMFDIESEISSSINYEALLSIIPTAEQMDPLLKYSGHVEDLDAPEQFVLQLWEVPNCKGKVESIVFWKNYGGQITIIEKAISLVIDACDQIFNSQNLKAMLGVVLSVGNFLNIGTPRGNARAIDIRSLSKLHDMRATAEAEKGNYNLLLFIVDFCYDKPKFHSALFFIEDLTLLSEILKSNKEDILSELNSIEAGIIAVKTILETCNKNESDSLFDDNSFAFYDAMTNFLDMATNEVGILRERHDHFQFQITKLVEVFATPKTPISEVFKDLLDFGTQLKKLALETEERKQAQLDISMSEAWMVIDGEAFDEDGNPIVLNNKKDTSVGIIDKLIKSIEKGEFGF